MFNLLHLHNLSFLQDLDGVKALVVFGLYEMHPAEATRTQGSLYGEILQRIFALCGSGSRIDGASIGGLVGVISTVQEVLYAGYVLLIVG